MEAESVNFHSEGWWRLYLGCGSVPVFLVDLEGVLAVLTATSVCGGEASEHARISLGLSLLDYPKVRRLIPRGPVTLAAWPLAHGYTAM